MANASGLLAHAASVLLAEGFTATTEFISDGGFEWVIAESDLFVVAVVDIDDFDQVEQLESAAVQELAQRLRHSGVGAKRWDTYLVLLSATRPTDAEDVASLDAIERDTRGVRRLASVGTDPTDEAVERALRPFIAMQTSGSKMLSDPFDELEAQLAMHGVSPETAARTVGNFRQRGTLDDV